MRVKTFFQKKLSDTSEEIRVIEICKTFLFNVLVIHLYILAI